MSNNRPVYNARQQLCMTVEIDFMKQSAQFTNMHFEELAVSTIDCHD